jgi:hypothetical protein
MPGKYSHTTRPPYAILYANVYNADHQNHIDHLEPQYIDRDGTTLADMQAVNDPGNDGAEVQPTTLSDEIRQLRNEIKVLKSYIAQTAPANWYSKLASNNRAFLKLDGSLVMQGPVRFPASQISSSDPNGLDDYEEGTWTPSLYRSSTQPNVTYGTRSGTYTKIGNAVSTTGYISISSISSQGAGDIGISGFPFTNSVSPTSSICVVAYSWASYNTAYGNATLGGNITGTVLYLQPLINGTPNLNINLDAGMWLKWSLLYFTYT